MADAQDEQNAPDVPESMKRERLLHEQKVKEFELKRKLKTTVVPTNDAQVRQMLRDLGEPITLFGEREMERRSRLQILIAQRGIEAPQAPAVGQIVIEEVVPANELFYTPGSKELKAARHSMLDFSLHKARERLKRQREDAEQHLASAQRASAAAAEIKQLAQQCSEMGDDRPLSGCEFSPNGELIVTCSWGGVVSLWHAEACKKQLSVRAHEDRCTGVTWHPKATTSQPAEGANLATACADSTASIWSASGRLLHKLTGHTDRLAKLAFHPSGDYLATASYDQTWRLWDVGTGACLLEQEGHSRAVYAVGFHPDGSLVGSAGLDAIGRVWDCRTGRSIFVLQGHVKQILALDFSCNGFHLVTGSDDHTCKVWDLRSKKCLYTIPGHRSLVSSVRYERSSGSFIVSGGYDALVKVWSSKDFSLLKTLAGHEGKVMGVDVSPSSSLFASVSYDRTIKLWAPELLPDLEL